ncbi:MAG: hypothetical protein M0Q41_04420 [Bacteroidales bacterium]|nr:hypothetical protein [Bacteroidales bacterium]
MNPAYKRFLFFLVWGFMAMLGHAQTITHSMYHFSPKLVLGAGTGASISFTDIKVNTVFPSFKPINEWREVSNLSMEFEFIPILSLKGQLATGRLAGANSSSTQFFVSHMREMHMAVLLYPKFIFIPYRTDYRFHPYIQIGIGLLHYNTRLYSFPKKEILVQRGFGAGSGLFGMVIEGIASGGIGFNFKIDEHWNISFETANRWINDDKLDTYPSARSSPYDFYNFTMFGVSYKFFKRHTYPLINAVKSIN